MLDPHKKKNIGLSSRWNNSISYEFVILSLLGTGSSAILLTYGLNISWLPSIVLGLFVWFILFGGWKIDPRLASFIEKYILYSSIASRSKFVPRLSDDQKNLLVESLLEFKPVDLTRLIRTQLNQKTGFSAEDLNDVRIRALIDRARRERWLMPLIDVSYQFQPNKKLALLLSSLGKTGAGRAQKTILESIVRGSQSFNHINDFVFRLTLIELCVCRISYPTPSGTVFGTGFLVAPDLLLTSHHVIEPLLEGKCNVRHVECAFDYKKTTAGELASWTGYQLHKKDWHVASSPSASSDRIGFGEPKTDELDFALLKLAEPVGKLPIGAKGQKKKKRFARRGWLTVASQPAKNSAKGAIAMIIQHPDGNEKSIAFGEITGIHYSGLRLRHNVNTVGGSSGSPLLTANLEIAAIHHAGDPNFEESPKINQAVPMDKIIKFIEDEILLEKIVLTAFWDDTKIDDDE